MVLCHYEHIVVWHLDLKNGKYLKIVLTNKIKEMLTDVLKAMVNNPFKEIFYVKWRKSN